MHQDITVVGLDLAKRMFQVHAIGADGKIVSKRKLRRSEVLRFFSALHHASSDWKPVPQLTTGVGSSLVSAMTFD